MDDHSVDVWIGPAPELSREVADVAGADVEGLVGAQLAGVEEEPGAVVRAEAARLGRGDVEEVVDTAAAEDAGDAGAPDREGRAKEEPREQPPLREQLPHQLVPLPANHVTPRAAHEGHAAVVDAARDVPQDQALGFLGEFLHGQGLRRRGRSHGFAGWVGTGG